ncbi:cysteine desulfurase family protein [Rhodopirellula maiorica SM1]|uniref:cysteine desulfurase n=1 Tax=Rhodopirellula maiorica SM1 TaxID=1265738 RepID=M5RUD9_9BACT|nr:aminotransferase class V-fold PLP-dependent enzyme [Rhodopirellula maiorica]EMI22786.1 cysteine desulfurase family protein [Rhodopirellula maiorica SM1]
MTLSRRIYFDHAATSWPKHTDVLDAMDRYARDCGAASGRGQYQSANMADGILHSARLGLSRLIGSPTAESIAFFSNGTQAINAAIGGIVRDGDHVVTTAAEHNSVLRPLSHLAETRNVTLTIVDCDHDGVVQADDVLDAVTGSTRLVAVTSASNVTGAEQPIQAIGSGLRSRASTAAFLCDAAQTLGYLPIDVQACGIDLLAAPGHKGIGGPQGTGFLYVSPSWHDEVTASVFGGTGSQSESLAMPTTMPAKLEPGNLNVAAIAGLDVAVKQIASRDDAVYSETLLSVAHQLNDGLRGIKSIRVFGQPSRLPIVSIAIDGFEPTDLSAILDSQFSIETRAGLHCAALIHKAIGSAAAGTLRISGSASTSRAETAAVIEAVRQIADSLG